MHIWNSDDFRRQFHKPQAGYDDPYRVSDPFRYRRVPQQNERHFWLTSLWHKLARAFRHRAKPSGPEEAGTGSV